MGRRDLRHQPALQRRDAQVSPTPAITSGPMVRAVVARRGWPHRVDRVPRRWSGWARERVDRGARRDRAYRTAPMSVLGRLQVVHTGRGRLWQSFSHSAALHLAVHPVVGWRAGGQGGGAVPDRRTAGQVVALYRSAAQPTVPAVARVAARARRVPGRGRRVEARPPRGTGGTLREPGPAAEVGTGRALGGGVHAVRRLVEDLVIRVARGHRRIEVPARQAAVIRDRASVAVEVERALTTSDRRASGRDGTAPGATGSPRATGPLSATGSPAGHAAAARTPVDLDRLTDQIVTRLDDRLTAHRERLGRAF